MKMQTAIAVVAAFVMIGLVAWAAGQPPKWQVIAEYNTGLAQRSTSQSHNAKLAAQQLNGRIIQPGAEFSFNRIVKSWTPDRGYVKAPVSYDGELIPAWGGGVCQTSSTVYNAALLAGLDITERHRHHFPARYVPPGQDAAVAQYDIDLRFRNPYKSPIRIESGVDGDRLYCRILSQQSLKDTVSIGREIRQVIAPSEVIRAKSPDSEFSWRVINRGEPGLHVAVYRTIGSTRSLISEDTYPPMNRLVERR